jgi:hypothetical protein
MAPLRHLIRAAVKLREAYVRRAVRALQEAFLKRVSEYERQKQITHAWLGNVADGNWVNRSLPLRRHLGLLVQSVQRAAADLTAQVQQTFISVPDMRALIEELQQIEDEFGGIEFDLRKKRFSVATEPITLEEVYLGDFDIRFQWERVHQHPDSLAFDIVALDPHPPSEKPAVTHPHVNDKTLCAGDAAIPIKHALEQGRIADAFCLVRSVLLHYNRHSPFVPLEEWGGHSCYDCGSGLDSDDLCLCAGCDQDFCSDCVGGCTGCERVICRECQKVCPGCSKSLCEGCLSKCAACQTLHCSNCLEPTGDQALCRRCSQASISTSTDAAPPTVPLETHDESSVLIESPD